MTHEDLRKRAVQWLTNTKRCGVVLSEMMSGTSEIPDAIGWKGHNSYLIECKVSRDDWHRDKYKIHARCGRGVGQFRYIMVAKTLADKVLRRESAVTAKDLEGSDYGLLAVGDHGISVLKEAEARERCQDDEITMLVSALRRVRAREFLVLVRPPDE